MIKFSEASAIALHSMVYIYSKKDKAVSLKEIAKRFDISENHASKILQRLVKANYLLSSKGPAGGFQIKNYKKEIYFMEIYETIEGKMDYNTCLFSSKPLKCKDCIMGTLVCELKEKFTAYMNSHKISDFTL